MFSLGSFPVFLTTLFDNCTIQECSSCTAILTYIQKNLPPCGVLKNSNGFVYVDLDDEYVHTLITFIQEEGFQKPPYFGKEGLVGAHISVIYPEEIGKYEVEKIQEYGETIHFIPKECQVAHPLKLQGIDKVYLIVVEAPELDKIREKYGLPKKKHEFHITIGAKPKVAHSA